MRQRLALIVAPARLRPGQSARVRVTDTWGQGGSRGRVCARAGTVSAGCRTVRLARGNGAGAHELRAAPGRALDDHAARGLHARAVVAPRRRPAGARYRVLVTGDSMVFGIIDVLTRSVRETGGTLKGDPHPGTGITKPSLLKWPEHAARSVREERPDASVVFLGAAVDTFPLVVDGGRKVACCGPDWVGGVHAPGARDDGLLPARRQRARVLGAAARAPRRRPRRSIHAINRAILAAAATFPDGIRVVDIGPAISPGDVYREQAMYRGRRRSSASPTGSTSPTPGVHLATA